MFLSIKVSWFLCNIALAVIVTTLLIYADHALNLSTVDITVVELLQHDWSI
jgi:hypothetical protein